VKDFKELRVWSKAHELTVSVYVITRTFPKDEMYGLTSQVRRSAASIGANIAEGCGRRSDGELCRFLQIGRGSASETECHLLLAKDLGLLSESDFRKTEQKVVEVQRMLTALVQKVQPVRRPS
jgi:four helix bundle protein